MEYGYVVQKKDHLQNHITFPHKTCVAWQIRTVHSWLTCLVLSPQKKAKNQNNQDANSQTNRQTNCGRRRTGLNLKEIIWNDKTQKNITVIENWTCCLELEHEHIMKNMVLYLEHVSVPLWSGWCGSVGLYRWSCCCVSSPQSLCCWQYRGHQDLWLSL